MGVCLVCSAVVGACSARVTPRLRRPARVTPRLRRPARVTPRLRRPARVTPRLRRPARVTPRLRRPARVTPRLRRPARVTPRLRRPARVTSRLCRPARVTSRPCCLVRPALVGSCLIGPTWTWPSVPSPGSTSAPPPSWILLCVSVWKPLLGGGALSWIWFPLTQTAHHPWTTFPIMHCTHTFPSTITPITQLSPFTHQLWLPHHTCTSFSHSHKSSTQTLTQCEVLFCPGYISERSSPYLLSLCVTPDCPTIDLWTCACDLDLCLVLFTSLLCLWYSCYAHWPLPVWFCRCLINIYYCTWIPCLWPVFTAFLSSVGVQFVVLWCCAFYPSPSNRWLV